MYLRRSHNFTFGIVYCHYFYIKSLDIVITTGNCYADMCGIQYCKKKKEERYRSEKIFSRKCCTLFSDRLRLGDDVMVILNTDIHLSDHYKW